MNIGCFVDGKDMNGNSITGKLENILNSFGVVIVRTGDDRTHLTECYINDLQIKEK
jgi:hypothetical protein